MATFRETPYSAFNFLLDLGDGTETEVSGGFSEVSGLNAEVTIAEYRNGNERKNYVTKIPGIHKTGDVTLKRGLIGAANLSDWLNQARAGSLDSKRETVTIKLLSEDRSETVASWKLRGVIPIKWTGPTLTAKGGGDVAMEELVICAETIEIE